MSKKIAHFGTFDVNNYGDLLFPLIAEFRLPKLEWYHISPTNDKTIFKDSKEVISFQVAVNYNYDAIVTGGGNIIHLLPNEKTVYNNFPGFDYANLWVGASKLAAIQKIPHIFNGSGISREFRALIPKRIAANTFRKAAYIGLREAFSKKLALDVLKMNKCETVEIIPDTAFDIAKMWPINETVSENFIVVNLNSRYHSPAKETAQYLDLISEELKMPVIFVIIGACHGDSQFTYEVAQHLSVRYVIKDSNSLKEIAHLIGSAKFFFGSSMHAFITALSYDTRAFLVLNKYPMHKFKGLLQLLELDKSSICPSFKQALIDIDSSIVLSNRIKRKLNQKLDVHWKQVQKIITSGKVTPKSFYVNHYALLLGLNHKYNKRFSKIISKIFK